MNEPPCLCKTSWSNLDCPDTQEGCPAVPCDTTAFRWCEVDPSECPSATYYPEGDYHYIECDDENQGSTRSPVSFAPAGGFIANDITILSLIHI